MTDSEYKIFNELISNLEQARNLLCSAPNDRYAVQHKARFVDNTKTLLIKARAVREAATPL